MSAPPTARVHGSPSSPMPFRFGRESLDAAGEWRVEWQLKRNCSMGPQQALAFYLGLCAVSLGIATFFWWQGARMIMPFAWLELLVVGICMLVYARHAADHESIALRQGSLSVAQAMGNRITRTEFQAQWVKVEPVLADGSLIHLSGQGRCVAVGRFVRPELRAQLAGELRRAVYTAQA